MKKELRNKKVVFQKPGKKYNHNKEKLKKDLDDIFTIIKDAHFSYEIWWILVSKEGRGKHFKEMLNYKEFFQPTAFAHIISFTINLYKLFETRKDTLNFPRIIKNAKCLNIFDPKQIGKELKEAKDLWKKICVLRNKLFAHKNYHLNKNAIYKEAKIKPNNIKRLIELYLIIFNAMWKKVGGKSKTINCFSSRDAHKLFKDLAKIK